MIPNNTLDKLRRGEPAFGLAITSGSPVVAELFAHAGADWIWIETQHGHWGYDAMLHAIRLIQATGVTPIVRPGANDFSLIQQALDGGALGLIVPLVNSPEEAEAAVFAARYPPQGGRSTGGVLTMLYGDDYFEAANDHILLAVMIETPEAVARADEIAAVPGIDCIFLGPTDLCRCMGVEYGSSAHEDALQRVLDAARAAGVPAGFPCRSVEDAHQRVKQGFQLVNCVSDIGMLRSGIASMRERLGR